MSEKLSSQAPKSSSSSSENTTITARPEAFARCVFLAGEVWDYRENKPFVEGPNSGKRENWRPGNFYMVDENVLTNANGEKRSFPKLVKVKSHIKVEIGRSIVAKVRVSSFDGNEFFTLESILDEAAANALRQAGVV